MKDSLSVVRALYAAFRAKDHEAFRKLVAPEAEWIQNPGFPGGATHRGPDEVIEHVFGGHEQRWSDFGFRPDAMAAAGGLVLVTGAYVGRDRWTTRSFEAAAAHVYDVADGRVVRFRQFADTKTIWDAAV